MSDLLRVENVDVFYGDFQAVQQASFAVPDKEIVSIIGTNGAGKTTLMRAIGGVLPAKNGRIYFEDVDITGWPTHKIVDLGISQVPEGRKLFGRMSVKDNLIMGSYTPRARKNAKGELEKVYELFPILKEKSTQSAGSLSGGQQQMVAIGRALMSEPKLICFDEISLGLAPTVIKDIYAKVRELNNGGITIIIVEQDVKRSLKACVEAFVMLKGKVVLSGKTCELTEDEVSKAYFGM
ncbi:MAG: ABC transporter ATP-binding protein [Clostridiales Family XIII bacterium]|jgi:branched-chain amino acid transport system ATP-binding protein|nr:ABC transporter ATP-binding protein [Clostridiales Family XIII bacterium]